MLGNTQRREFATNSALFAMTDAQISKVFAAKKLQPLLCYICINIRRC